MEIKKEKLKEELKQQCATLQAYACRIKEIILECSYDILLDEIESIETILDTIENCKYKMENSQTVFRLYVNFAYFDNDNDCYKAEVTEIEMFYDTDLHDYVDDPLRKFNKKEQFDFRSVSYDFESEDFYEFNCLTDALASFIKKEINGAVIPWSVVVLSTEIIEKEVIKND